MALFAQDGCRCKYFNGKPCCMLFSVDHYQRVRDECSQLSSSELDLVVMGQLLALTQRDDMTQAKHHSPNISMKTFYFLHTISRSKFEAIKASYLSNGLFPRKCPSISPAMPCVLLTSSMLLPLSEIMPRTTPYCFPDEFQAISVMTLCCFHPPR